MEDALEEVSAMAMSRQAGNTAIKRDDVGEEHGVLTALRAPDTGPEIGGIGSIPMEREARIGYGLGFKVDVNDDAALARQMGELQVGSVEWDRGDAVLYATRYGQAGRV
jgi:hypothetical protein